MQILDLFSGIGGFSLGFLSANFDNYDFTKPPNLQTNKSDGFFKIAAHCEIDPLARAVLSRRFNSPIFDDVRTLTAKDLPKIDVITGGFPCQDLSVAGKRAGINGSRSGLFSEILRIAYETNAKFILFENSAELIKNKQNFRVFASELRASGYGYRAFLFKACDFGYPHKRERTYIIAYSAQIRQLCDETLFAFLSDEYTQEPSKEIIPLCSRYYVSIFKL